MPVGERYVGAAVRRVEDPTILTGRGRYVDDVVLPGMRHAAFFRSHVAHGLVRSIDVEAARRAPGVVAVFTGAELEELFVPGPIGMAAMLGGVVPHYSLLCTDKVRVVGDPIAIVVAESRGLAEDACELIEVDFDDLPPVVSAATALDPDSPTIFEDLGGNVLLRNPPRVYGDVDRAFAQADQVVRAHLSQHRHQNVPMEGRAIAVSFDGEKGELTVYSATQGVHLVRSTLAARLGLAPERVRVIAGDIGGSFGLKVGTSREEVAVAIVSKHLGCPVKWIEDRNENLTFSGQAREESFSVEAAVTDGGRILGLKVEMLLDLGAYSDMGSRVDQTMQAVMPGPYKIEGLSFQSTIAVTNKARYVAYRGPWAAETFVRERVIDLVARQLGLDPLEVRLRNVVTGGEPPLEMVTGRSLASVTAREAMERMAQIVDFPAFRRLQAAGRADGRLLGIGVASFLEAAPGPRSPGGSLGAAQARARLDPDGTVVLFTGQTPHGQSHKTTLAQVTADQMGVPLTSVRVEAGDTDVVPPGYTGGSRAATLAGGAALVAGRELRGRVFDVVSELLEASPDDLQIVNGEVSVKGVPARALNLAEVARAVATGRVHPQTAPLEVAVTFDGGEGGWSGGTHCAQVEVDADTGTVSVRRYVVVEDCGELINPAIVEGQIRGGVAQGIGAVLLERSSYDDNGQCLTGTFMDYLLPTAVDVPRIEIDHLETVPLDGTVNFRGVGEGGMIVSPAALCNAIEDALAPFGVRIYEQHLPPARILELMGAIPAAPSAGSGAARERPA
jgi:carbon-monoxide dehydrogenase large subunit